jgi:hypothetical protein
MLSRVSRVSAAVARPLVTRQTYRAFSGGDGEYHAHPMWAHPFNKGTVAFITFGLAGAAAGIIMLAVTIQQHKYGFARK